MDTQLDTCACSASTLMAELWAVEVVIVAGASHVLSVRRAAGVLQAYCSCTAAVLQPYCRRTVGALKAYCRGTEGASLVRYRRMGRESDLVLFQRLLQAHCRRTAGVLQAQDWYYTECLAGTWQGFGPGDPPQ